MTTLLHFDYETFSAADLPAVGAYRYAADPSSEILLAGFAVNDGEPLLVVPAIYETDACHSSPDALKELQAALAARDLVIYAHNAQFEIAVTKYLWNTVFPMPAPPLGAWCCTAALARKAALHARLGEVAEDLQLARQKDKAGTALIKKFSVPQPARKNQPARRIYPWDEPEAFAQFAAYCLQDVRTEREVHQALKAFELKDSELATFELDKRLNDRGMPVNVPALRTAKAIVEQTVDTLGDRFREVVEYNPTQRGKVLEWLRDRGYPFENLQAATVEEALDDLSWTSDAQTREALLLYSYLAFAAVAKIDAMLNCECGDGMVRGSLLYYGAGTGRWSGRLVQPQNFKRPTIDSTDIAYSMICDGCTADDLSLVFGNPVEVISSLVRHFIQPKQGNFLQADYSAVEARIVCWLADQEDALEHYRQGIDRYKLMATRIYHCKLDEVDSHQRWVAKQAVLGCGFQLWWPGFIALCAKNGVTIDEDTASNAVITFREVNQKVVSLWRKCDDAAKRAILEPGRWHRAGSKLAFARTRVKSANMDYLFMRLPSGRLLSYPQPELTKVRKTFDDGRSTVVDQITFYGPLPKTVRWGRVATYGGKLAENATQATAADFMANGACEAERRGFKVVTLIHDEALAWEHPTLTLDDFTDALCTLPPWAEGMPLAAEGKIIPYYLK